MLAFKPNKSTGLDDIGPRFLHDGAEALADVVTYIINLSISSKIVPECTKRAKVIPLYKKNNKLEVGNYRPVSILTSISKILEKAVHSQVEEYCLQKGNIAVHRAVHWDLGRQYTNIYICLLMERFETIGITCS